MSGSRGPLLTALCLLSWGVLALTAVSSAQAYEPARPSLDLSPDPIARSPRLMGMGLLTLADDVHNRIDLWNFAGNPVGVLEADSTSTFVMRPATASSAARHTPVGYGRERQDVASREVRLGYEGFTRTGSGSAYGFYGDASVRRADGLFGEASQLRHELKQPRVTGVLNGRMPYFQSERMRYAVHAFYGTANRTDEYRALFSNAAGDYLAKRSGVLEPPDFFTPEEYRVSTLGGGVAVSYRLGPWVTASVGEEGSSTSIKGENSSVVHDSRTGEDRPYYTLRTSAIGRGIKLPLEWGYDGRIWTSHSEERWGFTLKAGLNQLPFSGRGKMLDRAENGIEERARIRWGSGRLQLNGAGGYWRREVNVTPPDLADHSSFNFFVTTTALRDGADSLALPDSVRLTRSKETSWNAAYGVTWKLRHGVVGLEYHYREQSFELSLAPPGVASPSFEGPTSRLWDLRGGLEYGCTQAFAGRLGYIYRADDRDLLTQRNEYTSHTLTTGIGLMPPGSMWGVDLGWAIEWLQPDFQDITSFRESRQQGAAQVRWVF